MGDSLAARVEVLSEEPLTVAGGGLVVEVGDGLVSVGREPGSRELTLEVSPLEGLGVARDFRLRRVGRHVAEAVSLLVGGEAVASLALRVYSCGALVLRSRVRFTRDVEPVRLATPLVRVRSGQVRGLLLTGSAEALPLTRNPALELEGGGLSLAVVAGRCFVEWAGGRTVLHPALHLRRSGGGALVGLSHVNLPPAPRELESSLALCQPQGLSAELPRPVAERLASANCFIADGMGAAEAATYARVSGGELHRARLLGFLEELVEGEAADEPTLPELLEVCCALGGLGGGLCEEAVRRRLRALGAPSELVELALSYSGALASGSKGALELALELLGRLSGEGARGAWALELASAVMSPSLHVPGGAQLVAKAASAASRLAELALRCGGRCAGLALLALQALAAARGDLAGVSGLLGLWPALPNWFRLAASGYSAVVQLKEPGAYPLNARALHVPGPEPEVKAFVVDPLPGEPVALLAPGVKRARAEVVSPSGEVLAEGDCVARGPVLEVPRPTEARGPLVVRVFL